jgi:hypothetical protein
MPTEFTCEQEHSQKTHKKKGQEKYAPTDVSVGATNIKYDYVDDVYSQAKKKKAGVPEIGDIRSGAVTISGKLPVSSCGQRWSKHVH